MKTEELERQIKIKDEYMKLALDLMIDYDGYYNKEAKKGNTEGLASLIDEVSNLLELALDSNDKKVVFLSGKDLRIQQNILGELLREE